MVDVAVVESPVEISSVVETPSEVAVVNSYAGGVIYAGGGQQQSFTQSVASSAWTFSHNFGRRPGAHITDLAGNTLFVDHQVTDTQVFVRLVTPATGIVYLS